MRVIAVDGPAGAGKSTVARAVAERLGLAVLETGAMYRAVAAAAVRRGIPPDRASELAALARRLTMGGGSLMQIDGDDVSADMRSPVVGRMVSAVAAHPEVRVEMVRRQREWAVSHGGGVIEGRDIGTVVFPDADLKIFLTANDDERARRRGDDEAAADVARRDRLDSTRRASPLKPAADARVIDTTGRPVDEIVAEIVQAAQHSQGTG